MNPRLNLASGLASETGLRARNEDFAAVSAPEAPALARRGIVAAVADGIGGGPGGREAAEIAVRKFIDAYYAAPEALSPPEAGLEAAAEANAAILRAGAAAPRLAGMGTTLSALVLADGEVITVHIGDSRIYRLRAAALMRLTEDHNMSDQGLPHILTRALGTREEARPDCAAERAAKGDRFLLCTDGVTGALGDTEIADILLAEREPAAAARRIASAALAAGSMDNATALVVDVTQGPAG